MLYFKFCISAKQGHYCFLLLVARRWGLVFSFFGQLLFQAAFTITMHHGFVPVLAKIFGYVIFLRIILRHYHHLVEGLQKDAHKGYYGD